MQFNNHEIKLVIFDLDGTLIDSTSIWAKIDTIFFRKRGQDIPPKYSEEIAHVGLKKAAQITKEKYFPNEKEEEILKEWKELCYEEYASTIPLKNNAKELLELLKKNNITICLATANSKEIYHVALERLNIVSYFSLILDVNSCKEGKNSPEIYDKACDIFGIKREETLVFEDMLRPLITVYEAGFNVVSVFDESSKKNLEDIKNNSHLLIYDFCEILQLLK